MRYVAELQVQRAKELLTDSTLPVLEIAEAVGIRNPYYFSRFFKKQTGMSPSDYRRAHTQAI